MNSNIDVNNRILPIFNKLDFISEKQIKRITQIALPFFALYQPTALLSSLVIGAYKAWHCLNEDNLEELTITVCTIGLTILLPKVGILLTHGYEIAKQVYEIASDRNWQALPERACKIAYTAVFIASIVYATPGIIAISLIAQAAFELYEARHEFKQGHLPEAIAKVALATLRTYNAVPHIKTVRRNWFGKKVTQEVLRELVRQKQPQQQDLVLLEMPNEYEERGFDPDRGPYSRIELDKLLAEHNYSNNIEGIKLNFQTINTYNFSKLHFKNCSFNYTTAENCQFDATTFDQCNMDNFKAIRCTFSNSVISNSSVVDSLFYANTMNQMLFTGCDLTRTCLNDSTMTQSNIKACQLVETNFLGMQIEQSQIANSDLTDTLLGNAKERFQLINCSENRFTRPVIALAWNFKDNQRFASAIKDVLHHQKAIPLLFEYELEEIDTAALDGEVKSLLAEIRQVPRDTILSIADELVQRTKPNSQMAKLKEKANELFKDSHGIIFPGGFDIPPELYGKAEESHTFADDDYRRSIAEIAAINKAYEVKIPLMGICRGSQMVNVRNGGDLIQHVDDHNGTEHVLSIDSSAGPAAETMRQIMGSDTVIGRSMHHQANNTIGKGLTRVMHHEGSAEALIGENGNVILTQFHPETYLSDVDRQDPSLKANENIFRYFLSKADDRRSKQ